MRRIALTLGTAALAVAAACAPTPLPSAAPAARLPGDAVVFDAKTDAGYELFTMRGDGSGRRRLTSDAAYDSWWPKISPDRTRILFYRTPRGTHDRDFTRTSLWVVNADGTGTRRLLAAGAHGWEVQGHAEWSPDGTRLVMFAGPRTGPKVWLTDADGANPRQLTTRAGANLDPSWAPDGRSVLYVGCPIGACVESLYEVFRIGVDGTGEQRLTHDAARDHDPYFSPDGSTIAWLRLGGLNWSMYRMDPDGSDQRPIVEDLQVNSKPAWSVDSRWIFFHRLALGRSAFTIWKIRPDGSGLVDVPDRPPVFTGPAEEYPVNSSF